MRIYLRMAVIALCFVLVPFKLPASAASLPDVEGWGSGTLMLKTLSSISGEHGTWLEREYTAPAGRFKAILMSGSGAKYFYQPLDMVGKRMSFETDPILGSTLIVDVYGDGMTTLTLETKSPSISEDQMIVWAELMIETMRAEAD